MHTERRIDADACGMSRLRVQHGGTGCGGEAQRHDRHLGVTPTGMWAGLAVADGGGVEDDAGNVKYSARHRAGRFWMGHSAW
ncbi:hypothetical protein KCP78_21645 [Salmonella enterica subsp. enterica]|nr:hypothetical protein KCP78_21645 [Salmonella enterica subsp. enterica]